MTRVLKSRKRPSLKKVSPQTPPTEAEALDISARAGSVRECKLLWRNINEMGLLTPRVQTVLIKRAQELKGRGSRA